VKGAIICVAAHAAVSVVFVDQAAEPVLAADLA
jgi:hypothetical protein